MKRFEYSIVDLDKITTGQMLEDQLNAEAEDGWHLVCAVKKTYAENMYWWIFKREKNNGE